MPATALRSNRRIFSSTWIWALAAALVVMLSGCSTTHPTAANTTEPRLAYQDQTDELRRLIHDLNIQRADGHYTPYMRTPDLVQSPAEQFVAHALSYIGTRYKWGGTSPDVGFDCSGLVWFAANESLGIEVPRSSAEQAKFGRQVKRSDLREGDLVFFNTRGRRNSHVGIYVGDDRFVHAPRAGAKVRVESMTTAYWAKRYNGARRVINRFEFASAD